jgi:hypothetical protein
MLGLELEHLAVDGCTTKAPCGGQVAGPSPVDRRKQGSKRSMVIDAGGIPLGAVPARPTTATTGCWRRRWTRLPWLARCPSGQWCTLMLATTTSPAGRSWPNAGWSARSPPPGASPDPGGPPVGDRAHPRLGQPVRQAALVHRAPPRGGGVLAGVGQRRHRLRPAAPPHLDPLPVGAPSTTTAIAPLTQALGLGRRTLWQPMPTPALLGRGGSGPCCPSACTGEARP